MTKHIPFGEKNEQYSAQLIKVYNLNDDSQADKFWLAFQQHQEMFRTFTLQHINVLVYCNKCNYTLVFMTLAYKLIDNLSWLHSDLSTSQSQFIKYITDYVLPYMVDKVTAKELWASRCAILHTNTYESRDTEKHAIRQVVFFSGDVTQQEVEEHILKMKGSNKNYVGLNAQKFVHALIKSIEQFSLDILLKGRLYEVREKIIKMPMHTFDVYPQKNKA